MTNKEAMKEFNKYFQNILDKLKPGDAQEGSFYNPLENFIKNIGGSLGK